MLKACSASRVQFIGETPVDMCELHKRLCIGPSIPPRGFFDDIVWARYFNPPRWLAALLILAAVLFHRHIKTDTARRGLNSFLGGHIMEWVVTLQQYLHH